ncbi:MAG: serine/threonine-protein kinase [Candidatus Acidiferrales bacterium]
MIPEAIGKYRVIAPLGQGRVGLVYRAEDAESGRAVALKLVPASHFPTPEARQKFLQDAQAAVALSHPHLRQLYEAGESGGQLYLAREYLSGSTLQNLLLGGRVEPVTALAWGIEMAEALAAAHAAGRVHGELTPKKVFITEESTVKLLDTGLWRLSVPSGRDLSEAEKFEQAGLIPPMVAELAPEQIGGAEPDPRTDLFALGVVLYQMIAGENPFVDVEAYQTMQRVLGREPEPPSVVNPKVPWALDEVMARLLEKDPRARLQGASDAAAALRAVAAGEPLPAAVTERPVIPVTAAPEAAAPAPKSKLAYWLVAGGIVLAGLLWFLYRTFGQP